MTISRVVATRVPDAIEQEIRDQAEVQGISVSEWVRGVLVRAVTPPTKAKRRQR